LRRIGNAMTNMLRRRSPQARSLSVQHQDALTPLQGTGFPADAGILLE
jgi:hypothetical protein